mmetsp:Transcript_14325/g.41773  ORF Transcript_14325/g.41773 Transcript_14325/m.41773 type:complete len:214 (-) Transcript_14325:1556-2197(-)
MQRAATSRASRLASSSGTLTSVPAGLGFRLRAAARATACVLCASDGDAAHQRQACAKKSRTLVGGLCTVAPAGFVRPLKKHDADAAARLESPGSLSKQKHRVQLQRLESPGAVQLLSSGSGPGRRPAAEHRMSPRSCIARSPLGFARETVRHPTGTEPCWNIGHVARWSRARHGSLAQTPPGPRLPGAGVVGLHANECLSGMAWLALATFPRP